MNVLFDKQTEAQLQRAVAGFLSWALPSPWTCMPAGGGGEMRGKILHGLGLRPGWPDIQLVGPDGRYYGIELKAIGGKLSQAQIERHAELERAGAKIAVCRSLEEVKAALVGWGIPLHAVKLNNERVSRDMAAALAEVRR